MKINEIDEAAYPGNLGMMEMIKFYKVASEDEKIEMRNFISKNMIDKAWELLQRVTKTKLYNL